MCNVHDTKSVFKEFNDFPNKMHVFGEMQFVSHCHAVVSCQPILRFSARKNSAGYLSDARVRFFLDIHNLGFPTIMFWYFIFQIETELKEICNDVLILLQDPLIPSASSGESIVFYFKMLV